MNGGAGGGATSRVSFPSNVREMIRQIKEITRNHSEEEIYTLLEECFMDPNESTQKLLFQEYEQGVLKANWKPGMQGCWNKGGHGNYPSC